MNPVPGLIAGYGIFVYDNNMPQLYFRYSDMYEYILSTLQGEELSAEQMKRGYEFVNTYIKHWDQYNQAVFEYYEELGFKIPDFWIAYFVSPRKKMIPFSDPLTIFIKDDLDEVTSTLVHELGHVLLSFGPNMELEKELWDHIQKIYPENDFGTNIEIITILLARRGLYKIFGSEKAEKLLSIEKDYPSLRKAWQTIDSQPEVLKEENPIKAIFKLEAKEEIAKNL